MLVENVPRMKTLGASATQIWGREPRAQSLSAAGDFASRQDVFNVLVRRDHWVRRAKEHVDFLGVRQFIESFDRADLRYICP